ncbi:ovochymase-like [Styela clava]
MMFDVHPEQAYQEDNSRNKMLSTRLNSFLYLALLQICSCFATESPICGTRTGLSINSRSIGGSLAKIGEFPWQVGIYYQGRQICGGSIIDENWVLSAAHCYDRNNMKIDGLHVKVGDLDKLKNEEGETIFGVKQLLLHEKYDSTTFNNDIMLIELKGFVTYSSVVRPICLPSESDKIVSGERCFISGWGESAENTYPSRLQKAEVELYSNSECSSIYDELFSENMICAGRRSGMVDSCQGDSGGPLACKMDSTDQFVLRGIVSWGKDCADIRYPGVYTDVSKFTNWIRSKIDSGIKERSANLASFTISGDPCVGGSEIIGSYGNFSSPVGEYEKYPLTVDCKWIIKASNNENSRIKLSFTKFLVEAQSRCLYDYVEIYSGEVTNFVSANQNDFLGKYCGNHIPNDILSEGSIMTVHFYSDYYQAEHGFNAIFMEVSANDYSQSGCGGIKELNQDGGRFTSINYPSYYNLNSKCEWVIVAPLGKFVVLEFLTFDLYESDAIGCTDKVSIHDGNSTSGDILDGFCSQQGFFTFTHSKDNTMTVVFESGNNGQSVGFDALYQFYTKQESTVEEADYSTVCGITSVPIKSDAPQSRIYGGQDVTPGSWPWQVSLRACKSCSHICGGAILSDMWAITATHCLLSSPAYVVIGDFSHLSAEYWEATVKIADVVPFPDFGKDIAHNHDLTLIKFEEAITFNQWVRPICLPPSDLSFLSEPDSAECYITGWGETENELYSDDLNEAKVPLLNESMCYYYYTTHAVNDNMFCAGEGDSDACQGDSGGPMVCRTSVGGAWVLYGIISFGWGCGNSEYPGVYTKVSNYLEWILENTNLTAGPNIIWEETEENVSQPNQTFTATREFSLGESGCGGYSILTDQEGYFNTSLIFDKNYIGKLNCHWTIQLPPSESEKVVHLEIEFGLVNSEFVSPNRTKCRYEKLFIRYLGKRGRYGPYCSCPGTGNMTFVAKSDIKIRYRANTNRPIKGFTAKYVIKDAEENSSCAGLTYVMPRSTIKSPDYPEKYSNNMNCKWLVQSTTSKNFLKLKFKKLKIEGSTGCAFDNLKITELVNGENYTHPPMCGPKTPQAIIGYTAMLIEFASDDSVNGRGFAIDVSEVRSMPKQHSGCGGRMYLTGDRGKFQSMNYPRKYSKNADCTWVIIVETGYRVSVTFTNFDVEYTPSCKFDYVAIYNDKLPVEEQLVTKICGHKGKKKRVSTDIFTYTSKDNIMTVQFISDVGKNKKGFTAEYSTALPAMSKSFSNIVQNKKMKYFEREKPGVKSCRDVIFTENENVIVYDGTLMKNRLNSGIICYYRVLVDKDRFVKVWLTENSFINLDEEDCLLIYEGIDTADALQDKSEPSVTICGSANQTQIFSEFIVFNTSEISVVLISDEKRLLSTSIFKLFYTAIRGKPCGLELSSSWPWIVSLQSLKGFHFCSGILISDLWILTAASCNFLVGRDYVLISGETRRNVEIVIKHKDYNRDYGFPARDIALLKLSYSTTTEPCCLPDFTNTGIEEIQRENCLLLGWNFKDIVRGKVNRETIQNITVDLIPHKKCKKSWYGRIMPDMECGVIRSRSSCQSDVGGPLICQSESARQQWKILGLSSWGSRVCFKKNRQQLPNVFTWVPKSLDWIKNTVEMKEV